MSLVGLAGVEPATSPLSGVRSNQLSYRPNPCGFRPRSKPKRLSLLGIHKHCRNVHPNTATATRKPSSKYHMCERPTSSCKEVIQPQVPLRLPCYDFTPVMNHTVVSALPKVRLPTSGATHSHGVTGGVYKARERIHRSMLTCDY